MGQLIARLIQSILRPMASVGRKIPAGVGTGAGQFTVGFINGVLRQSWRYVSAAVGPHMNKPAVTRLFERASKRFKFKMPKTVGDLQKLMEQNPEFGMFVLFSLPALGVSIVDAIQDDGSEESRDFIAMLKEHEKEYLSANLSVDEVEELMNGMNLLGPVNENGEMTGLFVLTGAGAAVNRANAIAAVNAIGKSETGTSIVERHPRRARVTTTEDDVLSFIKKGGSTSESLVIDSNIDVEQEALVKILKWAKMYFHGEVNAIHAHIMLQAFTELPLETVRKGFSIYKV